MKIENKFDFVLYEKKRNEEKFLLPLNAREQRRMDLNQKEIIRIFKKRRRTIEASI